jgi:aspartate/methionine/tyrosine aminotransferase
MKPIHPSRRSAIEPFLAMDILQAATHHERAGHKVVHLEVGEPAAPAPLRVREAAIAALNQGRIGYTESMGRLSLRERIARHYYDTYQCTIAPQRIVITTGSSAGFVLSFLALFDHGARVAIAAPGYPAYRNILEALGIEVVALETTAASHYCVTAAMIETAHAEKPLSGVLLMSPANPSGTMMAPDEIKDICALCDRLGIAFISDEIYHGLTYTMPAQTALAYSDQAIIVNSFSKFYCMTGWRIGWLIVPDHLTRVIERLQQSFAISVPFLSQIAAEHAFDCTDELEKVRDGYAKNRAFLLRELPHLGITHFHPVDGAFYIYADIGHLTNDAYDFCQRMLREAGVAMTPGSDFDRMRGHRALRLSFAGSHEDMHEAVARLTSWLPKS